MQATIGGATVTVETGSLAISDAIGQRTTCDFRVRDDIGANKFVANQPVTVTDDSGLVNFAGFIDLSRRQKPVKTSLLLHTIKCKDMHYLADKRIAATSYANQTCGFMVNDLVTNYLAGEGVGTLANMCTANESNVETDTTRVAAANSTITRDTTRPLQCAARLKIDATG